MYFSILNLSCIYLTHFIILSNNNTPPLFLIFINLLNKGKKFLKKGCWAQKQAHVRMLLTGLKSTRDTEVEMHATQPHSCLFHCVGNCCNIWNCSVILSVALVSASAFIHKNLVSDLFKSVSSIPTCSLFLCFVFYACVHKCFHLLWCGVNIQTPATPFYTDELDRYFADQYFWICPA